MLRRKQREDSQSHRNTDLVIARHFRDKQYSEPQQYLATMARVQNRFVDDAAEASDEEDDYDLDEPNEYLPDTFVADDDDEIEEDIDDLDITEVVRKDLKNSKGYIADLLNGNIGSDTEDEEDGDAKSQSSDDGDDLPESLVVAATKRQKIQEEREKAEYQASLRNSSDDQVEFGFEGENGGRSSAYLAFKNRNSKKRKQAAASTRAAKARAVQKAPGRINKGKQPANAVVGRRAAPQRRQRKEAQWRGHAQDAGVEDEDEDDVDRMDDEHLPDYLRNRITEFKIKQDRVGNAALKLPPTYDDVYFSDDERMETLLEKPSLPKIKPCANYEDIVLEYSGGIIPAPIAQWLRDYQVKGAQFLHELFVFQRGGILGDDMGLGKTIQVISFLTAAFGKTGDERDRKRRRKKRRSGAAWYPRALIICPASLITNWCEELDRWGWWDVYEYHGSASLRKSALDAAKSGSAEIMLTTYDTYKNNRSAINTVDWDCVIADEFHHIKNRLSETTKAMGEVNAMCRIGLTGTAIQNNYDEFFTLLNWTNPGKFGSVASWKSNISVPLQAGQAHGATEWQLGTARKLARSLVDNLLPQFFLRRMKSLIADQLPKKSDRVVFCPLTDTQADAYSTYVSSERVEHMRGVTSRCNCGSGKTYGACCGRDTEEHGDWRRHVFPTMVTLQKLSNHIAMIIPSKRDSLEKQDKDVEYLKMAFPDEWRDLYAHADSIYHYANPEFCGKWRILQKLLQFWHANGDKVLIFSHSVRLLKSLHLLFDRQAKYNVLFFSGEMTLPDRHAAVQEFNADPKMFILLISTKAGGVGLNITSANKVVIMDPNWNPAYDQQAQDRAYRIGQTRDVEVFRLISAGTIEEIVYARQVYKQQQANIGYTASEERRYFTGIQDNPDQKGEIFGLANMFSYQGEGVRLQQIVNKTNVAESRLGVAVSDIDMTQAYGEEEEQLIGDEDTAMKELEALITKGEGTSKKRGNYDKYSDGKKLDPVQAILANAGVSYTHENSEVIGTSRTEARLSRRAAEAATTTHEVANRPVFGASTSQSNGMADEGSRVTYRYNPNEEVRKRHFCSMARQFGFRDAVEFALVVEGWTQRERRSALERFYWGRRQLLLGGGAGTDGKIAPITMDGGGNEGGGSGDLEEGNEVVVHGKRNEDDDDMTDDEL